MSEETGRYDAHKKPPSFIKDVYKRYQKLSTNELDQDPKILEFSRNADPQDHAMVAVHKIPQATITSACHQLLSFDNSEQSEFAQEVQVYEAKHLPGQSESDAAILQ
ncbi:hypothetical protein ACLMJK_007947 [Lecanora helva]